MSSVDVDPAPSIESWPVTVSWKRRWKAEYKIWYQIWYQDLSLTLVSHSYGNATSNNYKTAPSDYLNYSIAHLRAINTLSSELKEVTHDSQSCLSFHIVQTSQNQHDTILVTMKSSAYCLHSRISNHTDMASEIPSLTSPLLQTECIALDLLKA